MSTVKFRSGIEFKRYVAGKMELERADKRFFPDKPKAMGDMVEMCIRDSNSSFRLLPLICSSVK